jgi:hypothetical protein
MILLKLQYPSRNYWYVNAEQIVEMREDSNGRTWITLSNQEYAEDFYVLNSAESIIHALKHAGVNIVDVVECIDKASDNSIKLNWGQ